MNSVLVICIGNICRSPMAEGLLKTRFPSMNIASAGVGAMIGRPADPTAVNIMADHGIDISGHIARQLTTAMCREFEMIFVMDKEQRKFIESHYPFARGRVFLISNNEAGVPDPHRGTYEDFKNAFDLIEDGVGVWADLINRIISKEERHSV